MRIMIITRRAPPRSRREPQVLTPPSVERLPAATPARSFLEFIERARNRIKADPVPISFLNQRSW